MNKACAFMKDVWNKVKAIACLVWAKIVELLKLAAPKVKAAYAVVKEKTVCFFKSATADRSKMILAIILAVSILFSTIAVVKAVSGIVNGVIGIFQSDESDDEDDEAEAEHAEVNSEICKHCVGGKCIHCEKGFIDCPDCDKGVCAKCEGQGANPSKMLSLLIDNCTACRGSGKCTDCNENYMIDCKYCDGGMCTECDQNKE